MNGLCLLTLLGAISAGAAPTADEIARKAAEVVAAQRKAHPRYSYRLVRVNRVVQGEAHFEVHYDMRVHMLNESIDYVEYLSVNDNGRALNPSELKQLAAQSNEADKKAPRFHAPYEASALGEYEFQDDGQETVANYPCYRIRFRSRVLDAQHGHGLMWVDTKTFNVIKLAYDVAGNPSGVRAIRVELYRAPALSDLWSLARMYRRLERGERDYEESASSYSEFREP